MGGVHGVETVEPLLTFFLADGELLAPPVSPRRPGPGPQPVAPRAPKARARAAIAHVVWPNSPWQPLWPKG